METSIRYAVIQNFIPTKGFGFLQETTQGKDGLKEVRRHFFHVTDTDFEPQIGQMVSFQLGLGRKGPAAVMVRLISVAPAALVVKPEVTQ